jgi:hypothetical protein
MVSDQKGRLHGTRGNLKGLDNKRSDEQGQQNSDSRSFSVLPPDTLFLDRLCSFLILQNFLRSCVSALLNLYSVEWLRLDLRSNLISYSDICKGISTPLIHHQAVIHTKPADKSAVFIRLWRIAFGRFSLRRIMNTSQSALHGAPAQSPGFRKLNLQASNTLLAPRDYPKSLIIITYKHN